MPPLVAGKHTPSGLPFGYSIYWYLRCRRHGAGSSTRLIRAHRDAEHAGFILHLSAEHRRALSTNNRRRAAMLPGGFVCRNGQSLGFSHLPSADCHRRLTTCASAFARFCPAKSLPYARARPGGWCSQPTSKRAQTSTKWPKGHFVDSFISRSSAPRRGRRAAPWAAAPPGPPPSAGRSAPPARPASAPS